MRCVPKLKNIKIFIFFNPPFYFATPSLPIIACNSHDNFTLWERNIWRPVLSQKFTALNRWILLKQLSSKDNLFISHSTL